MIIFFIENIFLNYVVFFLNHKGSIKFFFQLINPSNLWMFLLSSYTMSWCGPSFKIDH